MKAEIRRFQKQDIGRVMSLWLEGNTQAHGFIEKNYWSRHFDEVKKAICKAEVYLYEEDGRIQGFIGVTDGYIAGLFVASNLQSRGIGRQLLNYIKKAHPELTLHVYRKNERAVKFYQREHFIIQAEGLDDNTGEEELLMVWKPCREA